MKRIIFSVLFIVVLAPAFSQSISELKQSYSGKIKWNKKSQTLEFISTGSIFFTNKTGEGKDLENDHKIIFG